MLEIKCS